MNYKGQESSPIFWWTLHTPYSPARHSTWGESRGTVSDIWNYHNGLFSHPVRGRLLSSLGVEKERCFWDYLPIDRRFWKCCCAGQYLLKFPKICWWLKLGRWLFFYTYLSKEIPSVDKHFTLFSPDVLYWRYLLVFPLKFTPFTLFIESPFVLFWKAKHLLQVHFILLRSPRYASLSALHQPRLLSSSLCCSPGRDAKNRADRKQQRQVDNEEGGFTALIFEKRL